MSRRKKKFFSLYRWRHLFKEVVDLRKLPSVARTEYLRDNLGMIQRDPGCDVAIKSGISWLCTAQDNNACKDGGFADTYSLLSGWGASYPETTGYIIPTMIQYSHIMGNKEILNRARRMLDWLVSIQYPDGSFQGGAVDVKNKKPTVFNTGQILIGLANGVKEFGEEYRTPMRKAADWLVSVQDPDGCWRKYSSPFVVPGDKAYDTHVAWGLLEAEKVDPGRNYAESAMANVSWAITQQQPNGWFQNCDLTMPDQPLTHTLAYVLRGIIEAYLFSHNQKLLDASCLTANSLLDTMEKDGYIAGRFFKDWQPAQDWVCMTGTAQIAICWFLLYQITGESKFKEAAFVANRFVRRRMKVDGSPFMLGGIKGACPVNGAYGAYSYLNWACKFFVDANILENEIRSSNATR
jgi:hypothetical protein